MVVTGTQGQVCRVSVQNGDTGSEVGEVQVIATSSEPAHVETLLYLLHFLEKLFR